MIWIAYLIKPMISSCIKVRSGDVQSIGFHTEKESKVEHLHKIPDEFMMNGVPVRDNDGMECEH